MFFLDSLVERGLERGLELAFTHKDHVRRFVQINTVYRTKRVRISIAAMLRHRVNDDYVLIKNKRRSGRFGPIGGVIRYFPSAKDFILDEIEYEDQIPFQEGPSDLRGYITGKHFHKFFKWFCGGKYVEKLTVQREMEEELNEIGFLEMAKSCYRTEIELVRAVHEGPSKVPGEDYLQYRLFYIYQLQTEDPFTAEFAQVLNAAVRSSSDLLVASRRDILRGRSKAGAIIGDHSGYLFGTKRVGSEPPAF